MPIDDDVVEPGEEPVQVNKTLWMRIIDVKIVEVILVPKQRVDRVESAS